MCQGGVGVCPVASPSETPLPSLPPLVSLQQCLGSRHPRKHLLNAMQQLSSVGDVVHVGSRDDD